MVDRQINYAGAIPLDTDLLLTNKNAMVGMGFLMQAILGTTNCVDGLTCTPTSPATMTVNVGPGSIYSQQNVDNSAYGSLSPDTTDQIVKQGIVQGQSNFSCPAPSTSGFSIAYLIEATYQDVDGGSTVLPYYNASNPAVAYNGPNNTGVSQNTVRKGVCVLTLKAGTPATTGTQVLPGTDIGAVPIAAITVANGQTTITSGSIFQFTSSTISPKLTGILAVLQSGAPIYAADISNTQNIVTISLNPSVSALTAGMTVYVKVANSNTAPVVINTNGLGNVAANLQNGSAIPGGGILANGIYEFTYDGNHWQLQSPLSGAIALGQGVFSFTSGTVCTLLPKGGNKIVFPSGAVAVIPSGGIASTINSAYVNGVAAQTLSASTLYYAYLANIGGSYVIDWSTTTHATDGGSGIEIKSGDATRVLVGCATISSGGAFARGGATCDVRSWFNERSVLTSANFSTTRSTSSSSATEINAEIRNKITLWAGETVTINISGSANNSSAGDGVGTGIGIDSTSTTTGPLSGEISVGGSAQANIGVQYSTNSLSEASHFFTLLGLTSGGGTANFGTINYLQCVTNR